MIQFNEFSSGIELASYVTSSGLLCRSWNTISSSSIASNKGERLSWKVHKEEDADLKIIVFETTSQVKLDLVSSLELKNQNFLHFEFLCTRKNPEFQLNKDAYHLFYENLQSLDELKSHVTSSTRLIVTGQGLGGSVAILFTLSLLDIFTTGKNRPLCITFGSPLIGDMNLQKAMSRSTTWNSCFLQVVSHKDPLPRLFVGPHATQYMPFGTFLFCSDESSTCFENPESILEVLKAMASIQGENQGFQSSEYGNIVEKLYQKSIYKDLLARGVDMTGCSTLQASIILQLSALGLTPQMQQQKQYNIDINNLVRTIEILEKKYNHQKRTIFDPTKKLNVMKVDMVQLEWYKKDSRNQNIGYYDRYKNMLSTNKFSTSDQDVVNFHKNLTNYWEKMVETAELKPQKEGAAFRTRWLFAGTNYRRMVEPLEIANYYYSNEGYKKFPKSYFETRSKHYKQLEEWLKEGTAAASNSNSTGTRNVESILTFDSCFWAHVEEAFISCKVVKDVKVDVQLKEKAKKKLLEFEDYVYGLLKNYEVSSDIFLRDSSYMTWWNEYEKIDGAVSHSKLGRFMSNANNYNVKYVKGTYNFN
ncbi:senescence-associated carboxylesterase 101 isoform X1 [Arachis hypogaea]|uniref:senescence-associated carboxylesterase 101 isoform X1 n=1 Tax=Arachis hypogaea TaxID=3818 RepID=UPI000DEC3153|nr:senescence-associated carboxylesterase 101 isoform X1 [Arachis hypogaea]QHO32140.1 Senescence-associated carboxylesterase [Arachis hypogaea]